MVAYLLRRLVSLLSILVVVGLVVFFLMKMKPPKPEDWFALVIIFIALWFLGRSEKKRACELAKAREIVLEPGAEAPCAPSDGAAPAK